MTAIEQLWLSLKKTFPVQKDDNASEDVPKPFRPSTPTSHTRTDNGTVTSLLPSSSGCVLPRAMSNDTPIRARLYKRFFDLYVGECMYNRCNLLPEITPVVQTTENNMSSAAFDALSIGIIATFVNDTRLTTTAKALCAQAAYVLDKRIENFTTTHSVAHGVTDDALSATHTLIVCAHLDCIGAENRDWLRYNIHLSRLSQQHGWPRQNDSLHKTWLERVLYSGLITRRHIKPHTIDTSRPIVCYSFLRTCASDVPELLEETDKLLDTNSTVQQSYRAVVLHLTKLEAIKASIKKLHLKWTSDLPTRFYLANITTFKDFRLFRPPSPSIFTSALRFRRLACEAEFRASVSCLLEISKAILDINVTYATYCIGAEFEFQFNLAREDARCAADTLCMLIPRCLEPESGAFSVISALTLLHFTSRYYAKYGHDDQLAWCEQVKEGIKNKYGFSINMVEER